jgi:hypothetical protein
MSGRKIAIEIMVCKQMDTGDPKAVESMRRRVGCCLRKRRRCGELRSFSGQDQEMLWELVTSIIPPLVANTPSTCC